MRLLGQPQRLLTRARRNLENVAIVLVVVGDHVEHIDALDLDLREIERAAPAVGGAFSEPSTMLCARMPRPHAVGRKLLAGEMNQPDVATELALAAEFQKDGRPEHQGGGGRMIVVGAGRGQPGSVATPGLVVAVLHIGRVVVIGHNIARRRSRPGITTIRSRSSVLPC